MSDAPPRWLRRLAVPGACLKPAGEGWAVYPAGDRRRRPLARIAAAALRRARAAGLVAAEGDGFVLTPEGQAALKRAAAAGPDRFAAQHRDMAPKQVMVEDGRLLTLMANRAASPLAPWTRPGRRGGPPLLTAAEYAAGERLRADWFRSTLFRRVTADFTAPPQGAAPRSPKGAEDAPLSAIAAKDRVMAALAAAGPAGGRLLNALLFRETTMTAAETEAGLRRRGGRAALKQALARVAAYYGTK